MELKDYILILRRKWLVIIVITGLFIVGAMLLQRHEPPVYRAQKELLLKESPYFPFMVGQDFNVAQEYYSKAAKVALLKSTIVLKEAVDKLKTKWYEWVYKKDSGEPITERMTSIINSIKSNLDVLSDKETETVVVAYRDFDSKRTTDVLNAVVEAFRDVSVNIQTSGIESRIKGTNDTINKNLQSLEALEKRLTEKRSLYEAKRPKESEMKILDELIATNEKRGEELRFKVDENNAAMSMIASSISGDSSGFPVKYTKSLEIERRISVLKDKLENLSRTRTEKDPEVRDTITRIKELETKLKLERQNEERESQFRYKGQLLEQLKKLNFANQSYEISIKQTDAKVKELRDKRLSKSEEMPGQVRDLIIEIKKLEEERDEIKRQNFDLSKSKVSLDIQKRGVREVEVQEIGYTGANPIGKQAERSIPLFALTGLIIAIGSAYLMEYLNTSVRTEQDIKRYVNLPLYGAVLKIKEENQRLLLNVAPKSALSEVFNTVGTLVSTYATENNLKVLMIASSKAEEGKSTMATNLAVALARMGEKVILVDCDLRKAVLHRFFNMDNSRGLSTYLLSKMDGSESHEQISLGDIIKPTEIENLSVVTAGPHPKNPVLLLRSDAFKQFLNDAKEKTKYLLIDVPPVNVAVDTLVLSSLMDGVLMVVSAGETNKNEITIAKRLLEQAHAKIIGCILNKITIISHGYYYYYYYNYYDRYKYRYYRDS